MVRLNTKTNGGKGPGLWSEGAASPHQTVIAPFAQDCRPAVTSFKDKIHNVLSETRMLVLGSQILLGFQFNAVFRPGFKSLSAVPRWVGVAALLSMLVATAVLMAPVAFHRLSESGNDTGRLHRFAGGAARWALLPFALSVGGSIYQVLTRVSGPAVAAGLGGGFCLLALFFWYGLEARLVRHRRRGGEMDQGDGPGETPLAERIRTILTEARVILPGVQALLGFQLAAILTEAFDALPGTSKLVHCLGLGAIATAMILLMAPASYHRIVYQGEDSEHVDRFAVRMVLAGMALLSLALSGDLYVVARQVAQSVPVAVVLALLMQLFFLGLWFAYPLLARGRGDRRHRAVR